MERYCELANKTTQQLYKVSTPCIDDHHFKGEELKSVGELSSTCSQIVLKCLYLARIGRPDILWSVNKLARSITKWTKACDKRLNRLISKIHHTCKYRQYCHVGNTAKQCRLGLFQDSDFAGDLEDSKSTSGGTLCIFSFLKVEGLREKPMQKALEPIRRVRFTQSTLCQASIRERTGHRWENASQSSSSAKSPRSEIRGQVP